MVDGSPISAANQGMYTVGVLGTPSIELQRCLDSEGIVYVPANPNGRVSGDNAQALMLDLTGVHRSDIERAIERVPTESLPVIAAVSWDLLRTPDVRIGTSDFIVVPWRQGELSLRIARLRVAEGPASKTQVITVGDLVIDPERYDVFVGGRQVLLTFKEYELLKLLASNPGRVYSREALLEQVWGYQYFGGTRTVDVHIRRLRSKIEDATHTFIDTVWNVGYRFHG